MTIEQVLHKHKVFEKPEICNFNLILTRDAHIGTQHRIKEAIQEIIKYHIESALESACDNAVIIPEWNTGFSGSAAMINRDSILKCYPLENIQ